jgi:hypothetical protein
VPTPDYVRFATHYGFRPDFCEAADPESKASATDCTSRLDDSEDVVAHGRRRTRTHPAARRRAA